MNPTIIAECGINHKGCKYNAMSLVRTAKEAGADAAKFQLFTDRARPKGKKYILPEEAWREIMNTGKENDIPVFFSVFDFESVRLARRLEAKWVKLSFVERRNSRLNREWNGTEEFERKIGSVEF